MENLLTDKSEIYEDTLLGKKTIYKEEYSPELLFPIPRSLARDKIGLKNSELLFDGIDIWNGFELSWLNLKGKPEVALAEFQFPCRSPKIIESKSLKLYLNSFNQTALESLSAAEETIIADLSAAAECPIHVKLYPLHSAPNGLPSQFSGTCLDSLDIETDCYHVNSSFLKVSHNDEVDECLYSELLKSNCLATGQPDWGSLFIHYRGPQIDHIGLLKYIISFRQHSGFAEHCVEQIFCDLTKRCKPKQLSVYARYTKRGGLDINPFRSNFERTPVNKRHLRQ